MTWGSHMRDLVCVDADDVDAFRAALTEALNAGGPAVFPQRAHTAEAGAAARKVPPIAAVANDVALVIQTSGSTAEPKRVALSGSALRAAVAQTHDALSGAGNWVLALPVHYVAGAMVVARTVVAGTELLRASAGVDGLWDAVASAPVGPLYAALVPSQLDDALAAAQQNGRARALLRRLDAVLVGGQKLEEPLARRASDLGVRVVRTYGSTETAGGCVYDGRALGGTRVQFDAAGRVFITGPTLASGYLSSGGAGAFVTDAGGTRWWRSGDLGEWTENGRVRILGRADSVIISGGVKVNLIEVEEVLHENGWGRSAVAVAVDDPHWGQRVGVFLDGSLRRHPDGTPVADSEVSTLLDARFGPAGRPVFVRWLDAGIPMTETRKPDRGRLRDLAADAAQGAHNKVDRGEGV